MGRQRRDSKASREEEASQVNIPWCGSSYSWQTCMICIISFCLFGLVLERKKVILLPTDTFLFRVLGTTRTYYCSVIAVFGI